MLSKQTLEALTANTRRARTHVRHQDGIVQQRAEAEERKVVDGDDLREDLQALVLQLEILHAQPRETHMSAMSHKDECGSEARVAKRLVRRAERPMPKHAPIRTAMRSFSMAWLSSPCSPARARMTLRSSSTSFTMGLNSRYWYSR